MADWHVGMQVVCVDDGSSDLGYAVPLVKGCIYTISAIDLPRGDWDDLGVDLIESPAEHYDGHDDFYRASRFRPVRKTDISVFTALLNSTPTEARETAISRSPVVASLLSDLVQERLRCHADVNEAFCLSAGPSWTNFAARLALLADGAPHFLHHEISSCKSSSSGSKITTGHTHARGRSPHDHG